ncbi:MAG: septal ring lytic transglycosylase RlpA family protein [Balneolaceae bacterium]
MNRKLIHYFLLIFLGVALSSCGTVRKSSTIDRSTSSGRVDGRVLETGMASWYGPNFHGLATANGETYNMNDLTAAHKTLPFNTVVKVENTDNGKSVVVRINDRGPYVGNRIIDLSRKSAETVDMIDTGTANVRILLVEEGDRPITSENSSSRESFTVQLASFNSEHEARVHSDKINGSRVEQISVSGRVVYRVYYGTYNNIDDARRAQSLLSNRGFTGFVKQAEN